MKVEWEYEGNKYVAYDDNEGNCYLNGNLCNCFEILQYVDSPNKLESEQAKHKAKYLLELIGNDTIEEQKSNLLKNIIKPRIGISKAVFINDEELKKIRRNFSDLESKEWEYEGKTYIAHIDRKNRRFYINGRFVGDSFYIWGYINSSDQTHSWRAKYQAREIEIARLERTGVRVSRIDESETMGFAIFDRLLNFVIYSIFIGFFLYLSYQVWWFFVGDDAFEGPFADQYSAGETTADSIILFIVLIVVIEEVVRRIRNGHF